MHVLRLANIVSENKVSKGGTRMSVSSGNTTYKEGVYIEISRESAVRSGRELTVVDFLQGGTVAIFVLWITVICRLPQYQKFIVQFRPLSVLI